MTLPTAVAVGPYRYTVTDNDSDHANAVRDEGWDVYGRTDHRAQTITLDPRNGTDVQAVTLMHEILHTVLFASGADSLLEHHDDNLEEQLVQQVGPVLVDVLRRNPDLIAYLTR